MQFGAVFSTSHSLNSFIGCTGFPPVLVAILHDVLFGNVGFTATPPPACVSNQFCHNGDGIFKILSVCVASKLTLLRVFSSTLEVLSVQGARLLY